MVNVFVCVSVRLKMGISVIIYICYNAKLSVTNINIAQPCVTAND